MNKKRYVLSFLLFVTVACKPTKEAHNRNEPTGVPPYELVKNWGPLPQDSTLGQLSAVATDRQGNILLFHRTGRRWTTPFPDSLISLPTVTVLDGKTGKKIASWGANMFILPHGITVDAEDNVWVTDVALQQVFKFSHQGTLLMTLGVAKTAGEDSAHFNLPTDVAIAKDGSFYVSDGYGNSRVVKFSKEGKYLFQWGTKGSGNGAFVVPHAIDLDTEGNVYVADRENNRIEKFDAKGKFLHQWKNPSGTKLYALAVDKQKGNLFAVDFAAENNVSKGADVIQLDTSLRFVTRWGRSGMYEGPVSVYHDVAVDAAGNVYVAGTSFQKFSKQQPGRHENR